MIVIILTIAFAFIVCRTLAKQERDQKELAAFNQSPELPELPELIWVDPKFL